jgi:hypothetical protein
MCHVVRTSEFWHSSFIGAASVNAAYRTSAIEAVCTLTPS